MPQDQKLFVRTVDFDFNCYIQMTKGRPTLEISIPNQRWGEGEFNVDCACGVPLLRLENLQGEVVQSEKTTLCHCGTSVLMVGVNPTVPDLDARMSTLKLA